MTFAGCIHVMNACASLMQDHLTVPRPSVVVDDLRHCLGMVGRAREFTSDRETKAMRWLDFIQGVMWAHGVSTIDELKAMNREEE